MEKKIRQAWPRKKKKSGWTGRKGSWRKGDEVMTEEDQVWCNKQKNQKKCRKLSRCIRELRKRRWGGVYTGETGHRNNLSSLR